MVRNNHERPDIICVQETKLSTEKFAARESERWSNFFDHLGYDGFFSCATGDPLRESQGVWGTATFVKRGRAPGDGKLHDVFQELHGSAIGETGGTMRTFSAHKLHKSAKYDSRID